MSGQVHFLGCDFQYIKFGYIQCRCNASTRTHVPRTGRPTSKWAGGFNVGGGQQSGWGLKSGWEGGSSKWAGGLKMGRE